jgi:hypothetical protein
LLTHRIFGTAFHRSNALGHLVVLRDLHVLPIG